MGEGERRAAIPTLISTLTSKGAPFMVHCSMGQRGSAARGGRACSSGSQPGGPAGRRGPDKRRCPRLQGRGWGLHFICTHTHISLPHFVNGVCWCFTHTASLSHGPHPHPHPTQPCSRPHPVRCWRSSTGAVGPNELLWAPSGTGSR